MDDLLRDFLIIFLFIALLVLVSILILMRSVEIDSVNATLTSSMDILSTQNHLHTLEANIQKTLTALP